MSSSKISSPVPFAVLVVDDSSFITEVLKSFLLRFTPEVYTASDGKEGLEMFAKYSPPFVVSDVVMPNMNGLEMSREIKKINPDTFIVLTTAVDDKEYLVEAIEIAVDKYLPKPVDLKRLEKFLREFQSTLEVKKTLEENRKLLEEYKKAMDAAAIFTIGDSTGKITYVNEEFCRATGYEPKEAVGRYYTDFKHPDMPKSVIRSVQKTLSKKEIWKGIIENITKEGESFFTDATFVPILDSTGDIVEFLGISYDITGLQGMNENNFESIFNADESLIIATDDKFEIRIANKAMLDMLQIDNIHEFYDTGGAICNSFLERDGYLSKRDFRGDDHRERFRAFKAMLTSGDKKQRKVAIKDPKGDERLFAVRVSTVSDKMFLSRQYNIFSFVDITELEMMREQQINNIKLSSIGKLAAGITHEINTPLNVIQANIELLRLGGINNKNLVKIEAASKIISAIYDDLSYFIKKDRFLVKKEVINFSDFLSSRLEYFKEVAEGANIKIVQKITEQLFVSFDITQLQRMCDNNIFNAVKYSKEGSEIRVSLYMSGCGKIVFEIINQAVYRPDIGKIFNRFYRGLDARGGFGIGLSLVYQIAVQNNVTICCSALDDGLVWFSYAFKDFFDDAFSSHGF